MATRIASSADVDDSAVIGDGSSIWHLAQIREDAVLGANCIISRGAYVGPGVRMGDNCKLQNYALVYEPSVLEDGVFVGPAVVFTNDHYPRSVTPDGVLTRGDDWEMVAVTCREGASIGARSACVAPVTIGRWAPRGGGFGGHPGRSGLRPSWWASPPGASAGSGGRVDPSSPARPRAAGSARAPGRPAPRPRGCSPRTRPDPISPSAQWWCSAASASALVRCTVPGSCSAGP